MLCIVKSPYHTLKWNNTHISDLSKSTNHVIVTWNVLHHGEHLATHILHSVFTYLQCTHSKIDVWITAVHYQCDLQMLHCHIKLHILRQHSHILFYCTFFTEYKKFVSWEVGRDTNEKISFIIEFMRKLYNYHYK